MRSGSPSVLGEVDDVDGPACAILGDTVRADTIRAPEYLVSSTDHRQPCLANTSLVHVVVWLPRAPQTTLVEESGPRPYGQHDTANADGTHAGGCQCPREDALPGARSAVVR